MFGLKKKQTVSVPSKGAVKCPVDCLNDFSQLKEEANSGLELVFMCHC